MRSLYAIACLLLLAGPASGAGAAAVLPTDILPLLHKAGCNQGACHAKQGGRNGFQLSVLPSIRRPTTTRSSARRTDGG